MNYLSFNFAAKIRFFCAIFKSNDRNKNYDLDKVNKSIKDIK